MGKYLELLIVALVLSICSFFPRQLGLLFGEMGMDTGVFTTLCSEPIEKIVFQLGEQMGDTLMVYEEPDGCICTHYGDRIELKKEDGFFEANVPITLTVSCKWYMGKGSYTFLANVTTTEGQSRILKGEIEFPETRYGMIALQILFHLSNPIFRVFVYVVTFILLVLEIRSRQSTSAAPTSDPSQD